MLRSGPGNRSRDEYALERHSVLPWSGWVLVGLITVGFIAVFLATLRRRTALRIERKSFLTRAELEMLDLLRRALPEHHISCQVAMAALLRPKRGLSPKEFWQTRNRFGQKIVDFAAIDAETGSVEAIIELDDASHDARKDRKRDALLALGQYRVIRIPSKPRPTERSVRETTTRARRTHPEFSISVDNARARTLVRSLTRLRAKRAM